MSRWIDLINGMSYFKIDCACQDYHACIDSDCAVWLSCDKDCTAIAFPVYGTLDQMKADIEEVLHEYFDLA